MSKCDFCRDSWRNNKTGQLECPFKSCLIPQARLDKIIEALASKEDKKC